ncbi:MAG TPA: hypothetical protein DCL77_03410 [Prolixibacteraceae bacterium]|jgi:transposase-like protein|nr:hypothetical protein [Prolixibacteraceae bacterium]
METIQILLVIGAIILSIVWYRFRKRCPSCHKWNGLKKINTNHERTETRYRTETVKSTKSNKYGHVTGFVEKKESVPYHVNFYRITYKCSCGYEISRIEQEWKLLREVGILLLIFLIIIGALSSKKTNYKNENKDDISNQNNNALPLSNYPKAKVSKVSDFTSEKPAIEDLKSVNNEPKQKELDNEIPIEKPNDAQVGNKRTVITAESYEYLKRGLAVEMLKRGKDIDEISDSTYLPKSLIRKLRRNIEKK